MAERATSDVFERYGGWALVAGASAGLGAAFAVEAARLGFDVVLLARRAAVLEDTAAGIERDFGVRTRCIAADLAQPDIVDVVARATDDLDLGVFVYNAAAEPQGRFLDMTDEDDRINVAVNCTTPTLLSRHLARRMAARGRGAIALVSSMAALQGIKWLTTYGAGKAYELILGEGLWLELQPENVDALAYVVGATASTTFIGAAAETTAPTDDSQLLRARILQPALPSDVAARLFPRLHLGPRQFSHDTDELAAQQAATQPRADVVRAMGDVTTNLKRFESLRAAGHH